MLQMLEIVDISSMSQLSAVVRSAQSGRDDETCEKYLAYNRRPHKMEFIYAIFKNVRACR